MLTIFEATNIPIVNDSNIELKKIIYLEMPYHIFNIVAYIVFMQL